MDDFKMKVDESYKKGIEKIPNFQKVLSEITKTAQKDDLSLELKEEITNNNLDDREMDL